MAKLAEMPMSRVTTVPPNAQSVTRAGYFGPFGIDGFRYKRPDGSIALNPRTVFISLLLLYLIYRFTRSGTPAANATVGD